MASLLPTYGPAQGSIWDVSTQRQDGLKQPIFSPDLPGDIGGASSPAQKGVGTCHPRNMGTYCQVAWELFGSREHACG